MFENVYPHISADGGLDLMGTEGFMEKETLRDLRVQNKKTCTEVAQALGVANSSYYSYEQGARKINIEQVLILSKLFDCSEREIIEAQLNSCLSAR